MWDTFLGLCFEKDTPSLERCPVLSIIHVKVSVQPPDTRRVNAYDKSIGIKIRAVVCGCPYLFIRRAVAC